MALPRCDTWPHAVKTPIRIRTTYRTIFYIGNTNMGQSKSNWLRMEHVRVPSGMAGPCACQEAAYGLDRPAVFRLTGCGWGWRRWQQELVLVAGAWRVQRKAGLENGRPAGLRLSTWYAASKKRCAPQVFNVGLISPNAQGEAKASPLV